MHAVEGFYGVIGDPVVHSISPRIFEGFGRQTAKPLAFFKLHAKADVFASSLLTWQNQGLLGASITLPFKTQAIKICEQLSAAAKAISAVNFIRLEKNGTWYGDNTDAKGFLSAAEKASFSLSAKRILVIGAGGAARAVIYALLEVGAQVYVYNRSLAKLPMLLKDFPGLKAYEEAEGWDGIVDATALTEDVQWPNAWAKGAWCYSLNYGHRANAVRQWAKTAGAERFEDGLRMLIEQAAITHEGWTGILPETDDLFRQIQSEMADL